jgi:acetolactate synthase-1/2/3 large subunit
MGFWAGTIGCSPRPAIALSGDGAAAMNIQEFATLKYYNLPIKLFVYQNNGYLLIRHNQHNYMDDRFLGVGPDSGVQTPDYCRVADAYGLPGVRIKAGDDIKQKIAGVLAMDGPVICEVMLEEFGEIAPRIASRVMPDGSLKAAEFDDLYPFLEPETK